MKGLIKYLRYLFVSSILLFGCSTTTLDANKDELVDKNKMLTPMTREDSIIQLAKDLNIEFNTEKEDIHTILNKILTQKKSLIARLDSLSEKADQMERIAYEFKKKEDDRIKKDLLNQINQIKLELERIKQLAKDKEIKDKNDLTIQEQEVNVDTKTLEELDPGNYIIRLDRTRLLRVFVTQEREVIISNPIIDSVTVLKNTNISPRMTKELQQIRERLKNSGN